MLRLREKKVEYRKIGLILKRRKAHVIERWHELTSVPPKPPPPKVRYKKEPMTYGEYKGLRTKAYPTWLWAVTFQAIWARVKDDVQTQPPDHAWGSSKFSRRLNYPLQYRDAREASNSRAMKILQSSEVYLVRVLKVDVLKLRQLVKP